MTTTYLPSQVVLTTPLPLLGTMGRTERELAAALLVRACQFHGDRWQALVPKMIGEVLKADIEASRNPFASLTANPFARPDFHELVAEGYAIGDLALGAPIELTEKAFEAMRRWVIISEPVAPPLATPGSGAALDLDFVLETLIDASGGVGREGTAVPPIGHLDEGRFFLEKAIEHLKEGTHDEQGIRRAHAQRRGEGSREGDRRGVRPSADDAGGRTAVQPGHAEGGAAVPAEPRDVATADEAGGGLLLREEGDGERAGEHRPPVAIGESEARGDRTETTDEIERVRAVLVHVLVDIEEWRAGAAGGSWACVEIIEKRVRAVLESP